MSFTIILILLVIETELLCTIMLNKTVTFFTVISRKRRQCFPYCGEVTWGFSGPAFRTLLRYVHYLDARDPHATASS